MSKQISRRDILKGAAVAATGLVGTPLVQAASRTIPATPVIRERLAVGIIGCGGKGWSGRQWAAEHSDIVALCDVDMNDRTKTMLEHPRAASFIDYREMIDAMQGKVDAVVISTPDHHHATASALAMKAGMHTYCEKPLTRTIWEARRLAQISREKRVATQMGNQSTASTPMRNVAAAIKAGKFGHVKEIYLWTDRAAGWWPQGVDRPKPATCPKSLDFDLWLGSRPERPFAEGYHHFAWRGWWDFGTGSLGDMGCHIFNMPHMALDLSKPVSVQAQTSGHNRDSFPAWVIVDYQYPAKGGNPAFTLRWHDGGKRPSADLVPGFTLGGNGVIVVCEHATIYGEDESNMKFHIVGGGEIPDMEVDESPGHMAEFIRAAEGGKPAVSNFSGYSGPLTEAVLLGNLAVWADGTKVEWDWRAMKTRGTTEFDSLIHPEFKPGWSVM